MRAVVVHRGLVRTVWRVMGLAVLLWMGASAEVRADDILLSPADKARVEELTYQALEAKKAGHYERAQSLLVEAQDIYPAPEIYFARARVYEESGDIERAVVFYEECLARGPDPDRAARARAKVVELERRLRSAFVRFVLDPADAELTLDEGEVVGASRTPYPVRPGHHVATARAPGFQTKSVEFDAVEDGETAVVLHLEPVETPPEPPPESGDAPWVFLGALLGEGGVFDGSQWHRSSVAMELSSQLRFDWFRAELDLAWSFEAPAFFLLGSGVRGDIGPVFARLSVRLMVTPEVAWGGLLGVGVDIGLSRHWALVAEMDTSLWEHELLVLEGKLGVRYGF